MNSKQRKQELIKAAQLEDAAIREMVASPLGEKGYKVLKALFYDRSCYAQGDPYHTAFMEGQRSVVLYLKQCLEEAANDAMETS